MPIRVKSENSVSRPWARRDSRESLSSADHLIAVYSLESKDPSFDAAAVAAEINSQKKAGTGLSAARGGIDASSSSSWAKSPWAVCFPPQLQANVQQISERLKLDQPKIAAIAMPPATAKLQHGKQKSKHKHKHTKDTPSSSISCGYEFEHKEDREGNAYVLHIEQSDIPNSTLAFSDDDSACSWTSQNAVKFNKKLKAKAADAHCVKETNIAGPNGVTATELTVAANFWESWKGKQPESLMSPEQKEGPIDSPSHGPQLREEVPATQPLEKRDESEALGDARSTQSRHLHDNPDDEDGVNETKVSRNEMHQVSRASKSPLAGNSNSTKPAVVVTPKNRRTVKKAVRFTNPLVTSQHFRPKTRPEEVSLLYFDEDELEILEEDRETTSRDQFEMIAQELSENRLRISIAYQNRWRDHRRRNTASSSSSPSSVGGSGIQVAMSASDV